MALNERLKVFLYQRTGEKTNRQHGGVKAFPSHAALPLCPGHEAREAPGRWVGAGSTAFVWKQSREAGADATWVLSQAMAAGSRVGPSLISVDNLMF